MVTHDINTINIINISEGQPLVSISAGATYGLARQSTLDSCDLS